MLNWNRRRKTRARTNQPSISTKNTPTVPTAISTVQPLCWLKENQRNHADSSRKPSRARRATTQRSGVRRNQRVLGVGSVISAPNVAVRQCLLEILHARVGDVGAEEVQFSELDQSLEVS